jgi:hypothetical protein
MTPGQPVGCRADVLRIAATGIAFDLGSAGPWRGDAPPGPIDWRRPGGAAAWHVAWHALCRRRGAAAWSRDRHEALARSRLWPGALRLAAAARMLCPERAASAVDRLIGRGPGLTPAGDDVVAGFLGGLWSALGADPARRAFVGALGVAVARAADATCTISRVYLDHACAGRLAEPHADLRRAIAAGGAAPIIGDAMAKALGVGHTSGEDGALGLLLGLVTWGPDALFASALRERAGEAGMPAPEVGRDG